MEGSDSDYPTYDLNILTPVKQNEEVEGKEEKQEKEKNEKQKEETEKEQEVEKLEEYDHEVQDVQDEQQSSQVYPSEDMLDEQIRVQYTMDNNLYYEEGKDDRKPTNIDMRNFSDIKASVCN